MTTQAPRLQAQFIATIRTLSFAEIEEPAERLLVAATGGSLEVVARARNVRWRRLRLAR